MKTIFTPGQSVFAPPRISWREKNPGRRGYALPRREGKGCCFERKIRKYAVSGTTEPRMRIHNATSWHLGVHLCTVRQMRRSLQLANPIQQWQIRWTNVRADPALYARFEAVMLR